MLGILLIDKPTGVTSHDVVNVVRRRLAIRRAGHAGTLDPLATGLLVMAVGPATRFLQYLALEPKRYLATFQFGVSTDSQDSQGEVIAVREPPADLEARIRALLPAFSGELKQLPPMYSALKRAGRPLYSYARAGEIVDREERTVFIDRFELIETHPPFAAFDIVCSGGTYVRTLGHNLGESLGCGAHITALKRVQVGRFDLTSAITLDEVEENCLMTVAEALHPMPSHKVGQADERSLREGRAVPYEPSSPEERFVALLNGNGEAFAVGHRVGSHIQPDCVIPAEAMQNAV